jgi:hypothetical protein
MNTYGVIPSGYRTGCLPRTTKPGEFCPLFGSRIRVIPRSDWATYTGKISLRHFVREILNQGRVGSCASESSTQSLMIIRAFAGLPHVSLNPYFVYNTVCGGRDQGSTIDSNLKFLREVGVPPISIWPRDKGWQTRPSEEAIEAAKDFRILEFYDISTIEEMVTALFLGFPVVYGANGHAVVKVEHLNDREGLDVNSWGTDWGDGGFGVWVPYSTIGSSLRYGAFAVRTSLQNDNLFDVERAAI